MPIFYDLDSPQFFLTEGELERFWRKVVKGGNELGCWLWTGCKGGFGHGMFGIRKKMRAAHRISYVLRHGPIPQQDSYHGACVLHKCDIPNCVNPDHLWLGDVAENNRDRERKGRGNKPTGDLSFSRMHPERLARGDRHGSRTHPEALLRGEENGNAVLTVDSVREIRALFSQGGWSLVALGSKFGVRPQTIRQVVTGETWKHAL